MAKREEEHYGRYAYLTEMDEHPGEDCLVKAIKVGGKLSLVGAGFGSIQAAVVEAPTALPGIFFALKLMARHAVFLGSVGAAFGATACFGTAIRQTDDYKNWGYGGIASGAVIGLKSRSVPAAVGSSFVLGLLMASIKYREIYKDPIIYRGYRGRPGIDRPW